MRRVPRPGAPVSPDRIERALDGLAGIIADAGGRGRVYLPIFARLERELAEVRQMDGAMTAVLARAALVREDVGRRSRSCSISSKTPSA